MCFTQLFLMLTAYLTVVNLSKLEINIGTILLSELETLFVFFTNFPSTVLFLIPGSNPGYHVSFSLSSPATVAPLSKLTWMEKGGQVTAVVKL